jgi:hypothetical protein
MNCSVVSERRRWLEIGCSLMTCTTLTNVSAISTNILTDMGSTGREENWKLEEAHLSPWRRGTGLFPMRK